ncbi:serine carboxypeptidase [Ganoderma leucocontextum]|nr:serine carboxypeptidase [Ganoderma leucocontextum]
MKLLISGLLGLLSYAVIASSAAQLPFGGENAFSTYDDGLFTPLGDLSALSSTEFTTLSHPVFSRHKVRVKQSHFCDGSVRAYTGYIDIEARHLFFYFFESRRDPDTDDIIFWTNGGPGASSTMGLFMELGPCRVTSSKETEPHPYGWNDHANIFFVDQPVGVGFSYAEYGESVGTTKEAGDDITAFMSIFFEHFTKFKGRALHLSGESYGGRYIPVFASAIYDHNPRLIEAGLTPINLSSIMIGNGCTDFATMFPSYYLAQCEDPTFPAIQGISDCVRMKQLVPRCEKRFRESCVDKFDMIDCGAAAEFCEKSLSGPFNDLNHYDRARPCKGLSIAECYPIIQDIGDFLNKKHIQSLIGVDPSVRGHTSFNWSSHTVNQAFAKNLDEFSFPAHYYIAALLERGIRTLIYVGATDYICNWVRLQSSSLTRSLHLFDFAVRLGGEADKDFHAAQMGNEAMTLGLEWTRKDEFRREPLHVWTIKGNQIAGLTRSGGGLTFATIVGAGHMAPYDRPVESLELANRWLAGEAL